MVVHMLFYFTRFETGWDEGIRGKDDVGGSRRGIDALGLGNIRRDYFDCGNRLGVGESAHFLLCNTARARLLEIALAFG